MQVQEGNLPLSYFQEEKQLLQAITQKFMCQLRGLQLDSGHLWVCKNKTNWPKDFHKVQSNLLSSLNPFGMRDVIIHDTYILKPT